MDGVDAAMVLTDGETIFDFGDSDFRPFTSGERAVLRAAQGHWPGTPEVAAAAAVIDAAHIELLSRFDGA